MSEHPVNISTLNDFVFCPVSIYFHSLDDVTAKLSYQNESQLCGSAAHEKIDNGLYSDKKSILQGISVYSDKYNLYGKIDIFDIENGVLTERKNKISNVYDGYVFQLYAQYFALSEMGYTVERIRLYSLRDNKAYPIALPEEDAEMKEKFEKVISEIDLFSFENFKQKNCAKCRKCIYEPMCSFSAVQEE